MGYIYKITNDINDKIYIGKTRTNINKRWKSHLYDSKKNTRKNRPLYNAINKYGKEHFYIEELEKCDDLILSEREQYWIDKMDAYKNGYNATLGGDGAIIYSRDDILQTYNKTLSISETARIIGCHFDTVHNILRSEGINTIDIYKHQNKIKYGKNAL